jgi:hypothetical protein
LPLPTDYRPNRAARAASTTNKIQSDSGYSPKFSESRFFPPIVILARAAGVPA